MRNSLIILIALCATYTVSLAAPAYYSSYDGESYGYPDEPSYERRSRARYPQRRRVYRHPIKLTGAHITPEIGVSQISYQDRVGANTREFDQTALYGSLNATYTFDKAGLTLGGDFRATTPLSLPDGPAARYVYADVYANYILASDWFGLGLTAGGYFDTMIVAGNAYGYDSLLGPLLYPTLSLAVSDNQVLSFYIKYLPALVGGETLSFNNRKVIIGGEFAFLGQRSESATSVRVEYRKTDLANLSENSAINAGVSYRF